MEPLLVNPAPCERQIDARVAIPSAGLDDENARILVFTESCREGAAR
jgi:hypothetical protein